MENLKEQLNKLVSLMGFTNFSIEADSGNKIISLTLEDPTLTTERLPGLVLNLNRVVRLLAKKYDVYPVLVDVNGYRKERERLILELARAAARRAVATKEAVNLPAMNAYERRIIHAELSVRPDVITESVGNDKERYVVVRASNIE
ncbi:MAG: R3H domain-containing nucleic acid-binding protein [Patescibacteria group bacterium]|mgnify:CR=1 FL=1